MLYRYRCIVTVQRYYQILTFLRGWVVGNFYGEKAKGMSGRKKKKKLSRFRTVSPVLTGPNQKWELDFISDQLTNGRRFKVLTIVDL